MNDKEYTSGIEVQSKTLKKLDNFWYHYKWHTLITLFFVIVFTVCTVQMCTQKTNDMMVTYSGSSQLDESTRDNISKVLEHLMSEELSIGINSYNVLSESEIKDMSAETDENGKPVFVNKAFYSEEYSTYNSYMMTGDSSVLLLSPWLYESLVSADRLRKVSEITDKVDEEALVGEYGVALGKTELYAKYEALQVLPEDTVICLVRPYVAGKSSKERHYEREEALFKAILEYRDTTADKD